MNYEMLLSWNRLYWNFTNESTKAQFEKNQYWKHAIPTGIKVDQNGVFYAAVPRWTDGIPSTLNYIAMKDGKAILEPFPSWKWNQAGNVDALQSVMGYEIDEYNRMWILDQGKIAYQPSKPGSQKLLLWDLNSNKMIDSIIIPDKAAPYRTSFLNDLLVDNKNGFVYITDSGSGWQNHPIVGGIIIYNMKTKTFRRVLNKQPSTQPLPGFQFDIDTRRVYSDKPVEFGVDGIALSADHCTLYYCSVPSRNLYAIDTALLRDYGTPLEEIDCRVCALGSKGTTTDGMCGDNRGNIFYTMEEKKGIGVYNTRNCEFREIVSDDWMMWVDGVSFDQHGSIIFNHNKLNQVFENPQTQIDWNCPYNFAIWRAYIDKGTKSYLYGC